MENNEREYQDFIKSLSVKHEDFKGLTLSQEEFARQIFEFIEDYPSFRKKMIGIGDKKEVFFKIQQFLKDKQ